MLWDRRADGLPTKPEAVEWSAFPTASQKTGTVFKRTWFDWGEVTSGMLWIFPMLCHRFAPLQEASLTLQSFPGERWSLMPL